MTAGMAYEGLNQAGDAEKDLIVILNDNAMSISPNVGAFSSFLSRKMTGKRFVHLRKELRDFLQSIPWVGETPYFAADSGWGKVVSVNSEHKDIAWEFAKFATTNADNAKSWNVATGTIPALKSVAEDPTLLDELPWIAADLPLLQYGQYIGPLPDRDLFWYDIVYPHVLGVLQDIETIDEALAAIDAEANAMFE